MNLPLRGRGAVNRTLSFRDGRNDQTRNLEVPGSCCRTWRNDSSPPGDPLDKKIEDRLSSPLRLGGAHPPPRKMTVDVHPGKAVDQRPTGDLHLLEVDRTELAGRKRFGQR